MSKLFDVTVRVPARKLSPVLEAISGAGDLIGVVPAAEGPRRRTINRPKTRRGKLSGREIVLKVLNEANKGDVLHHDVFAKAFKEAGRAETSAGPSLSECVRHGTVKRAGSRRDRLFTLATRKKGAET